MARKTAMRKEPKQINNGFKTGGGSYLPGNPQKMKGGGKLERVSPGVYRNSQGQLVGSRGQQLGNRNRQAATQSVNELVGAVNNMPQADPMYQNQQMEQLSQNMQQKPGQLPPEFESGLLQIPQSQQQPIGNLAYNFPANRMPDMQLINRLQQQPQQLQQPNTVSNLLQRRFR